jgi:hypothetical protein
MNTDRPRIYLEREPQVSELMELTEPAIKLELTEAELALIMEWSLAHILQLEQKLGQLERSESLHQQLDDGETVARIKGRQNRISQLLEIDQRLDYKLYLASKS